MAKTRLITCVGVEHDLELLPHFLEYYKKLGILPENMHVILQASHNVAEEMNTAISLLSDYDVKPFEEWIAPYTSNSMWEKRREVQKSVACDDDWIISADVDEFHEFPTDLASFLSFCDERNLHCIQGIFIDRLAPDGELASVHKDSPIEKQFPIQADVMCTIRQHEDGNWAAGTVNVMACKGRVLPSLGGHGALPGETPFNYLSGKHLGKIPGISNPKVRFSMPLRVHHYKWTDRLSKSLKKRLSTTGVSERGKMYGQALLDHIDGEGRIQVEQMPVRSEGFIDQLPWKFQLKVFKMRVLIFRISKKLKRTLKR